MFQKLNKALVSVSSRTGYIFLSHAAPKSGAECHLDCFNVFPTTDERVKTEPAKHNQVQLISCSTEFFYSSKVPKILKNATEHFNVESKDKRKYIRIDFKEALVTCDTGNILPIHSERYLNQLS